MKTPDEMYESVIKRRDALMAERRIRRKKIVRGGAVVVSLIILVIISVWAYPGHKDRSTDMIDESAVIVSTDHSSAYMLNNEDRFGGSCELKIDCSDNDITREESTDGEETMKYGGDATASVNEGFLDE